MITKLSIRQADIGGTGLDGRRDGSFRWSVLDHPAGPGFKTEGIGAPGFHSSLQGAYEEWTWLRFRIPLPKSDNITIRSANLSLPWASTPGNIGLISKEQTPLQFRAWLSYVREDFATDWLFGDDFTYEFTGENPWTETEFLTLFDDDFSSSSFVTMFADTEVLLNQGYPTNTIPSDAVIKGVTVKIRRKVDVDVATTPTDKLVQLTINGTPVGDNKADTMTTYTESFVDVEYGGATDTWGLDLTWENIQDLGVAFQCQNGTPMNVEIHLDAIAIKVHYDSSDVVPTTPVEAHDQITAGGWVMVGSEDICWIHGDTGVIDNWITFFNVDEGQLFAQILQNRTIRLDEWEENGYVLIGLSPANYDGGRYAPSRHIDYRTWSEKISLGYSETDPQVIGHTPILTIWYEQSAAQPTDYDKLVEHDLTINQDIAYFLGLPTQTIEHTVTVEQEITRQLEYTRNVQSTLAVLQDVSGAGNDLYQYVLQDLIVEQTISTNIEHTETVESEVLVEQTIEYNMDFLKNVVHEIEVEQDIEVGFIYEKSVEHWLIPQQTITASGVHTRSLEHFVTVSQDITSEESILNTPFTVEHTLIVTQDISFNKEIARTVEHTLTVEQAIAKTGGTPSAVPFPLGASPPDVEISPLACNDGRWIYNQSFKPDLGSEPTIMLEYPVTSATHSVTLPAPLYGNREELDARRIQRKTRSGELITYADSDWKDTKTYRMKFDSLSDEQRLDLFEFLSASLGRPIKLTDHEDQVWVGILINPDGEATTLNRMCGHTAEIDIQLVTNSE